MHGMKELSQDAYSHRLLKGSSFFVVAGVYGIMRVDIESEV